MTADKPDDANDWIHRPEAAKRSGKYRRVYGNERRREQTLLDWFGNSESGGREISAKRMDTIHDLGYYLPKVIEKFHMEEKSLYEEILESWEEIVPDAQIRKRLKPFRVYEQCLIIEVTDSSTMFHVQRTYRTVLERHLRMVMDGRIQSVRFRQKGG